MDPGPGCRPYGTSGPEVEFPLHQTEPDVSDRAPGLAPRPETVSGTQPARSRALERPLELRPNTLEGRAGAGRAS